MKRILIVTLLIISLKSCCLGAEVYCWEEYTSAKGQESLLKSLLSEETIVKVGELQHISLFNANLNMSETTTLSSFNISQSCYQSGCGMLTSYAYNTTTWASYNFPYIINTFCIVNNSSSSGGGGATGSVNFIIKATS